MPTEVELKLSARPADLPQLQQVLAAKSACGPHPDPPPHAGEGRERARLVGTYYDTRDRALLQRGLTLRVREQHGRYIQTVKAGDLATGGFLERGEWEDALSDDRPDLAAPQSGALLPHDIAADLRPIFVTDVTRTLIYVEPIAGTRIETAIDEGEIRVADSEAVEPLSEIELEVKSGEPAALYDLALQLLEAAPIRIEARSKSERGYSLAEGAAAGPQAVHGQPLKLEPGMAAEAFLQKLGRSCLAQVIRNEAAVLTAQPEAVHQMRVALRRLRSAVSSLKAVLPEEQRLRVADELRWLARSLGRARNLDVFASELLPAARAGLSEEPGWDDLAARLDGLRRDAYAQIKEMLLSERYTATMLRLLRWFESGEWREHQDLAGADLIDAPIGNIAPHLLDRLRRRVQKRSKRFRRLTAPERHRLRIAAKKLRYTLELFGGIACGPNSPAFVHRLKQLQDGLGYANDIRVAHQFAPELFVNCDSRSPAVHAWISLLLWHDHALIKSERRLIKRVRRLRRLAL